MSDTTSSTRSQRWLVALVLLLAVTSAIGWRVVHIVQGGFPAHDEVVSYLHAAGKATAYEDMVQSQSAPIGQWVPATEWQGFLHADGSPFAAIAAGLGRTDVAPPMYFWLLNLWIRAFGSSPSSGLVLNIVLAVGTLAALFGFAREILRDDRYAALVCLVWAVMPPAIDVSLMVRQYDLLALATVGLLWAVARITNPRRSPDLVGACFVAASAVVGSLTQHLFVLSLVAAFGIALVRCWRGRKSVLLWVVGSMAAGWLMSLALNPYIWGQLAKQSGRASALKNASIGVVLKSVFDNISYGFGLTPRVGLVLARFPGGPVLPLVVLAGLVAVVAVASLLPRGRVLLASVWASLRGVGSLEWLIAVVVIGGGTLFFAMSAKGSGLLPSRYLAALWPLLAFLPVFVVRGLPKGGLVVILVLVVLLSCADYATFGRIKVRQDPRLAFAGAKHVVLDDVARGIALRYLWMIDPKSEVYVAWRRDLVDDTQWTAHLTAGDVVVIRDAYQPTVVSEESVLALLRGHWKLVRVGSNSIPGAAYRLAPLSSESSGSVVP